MTVRELINKLMDLDLDKPIYLTEFNEDNSKTIGYVKMESISLSDYEIKDVDIHGVYNDYYNCITISR